MTRAPHCDWSDKHRADYFASPLTAEDFEPARVTEFGPEDGPLPEALRTSYAEAERMRREGRA